MESSQLEIKKYISLILKKKHLFVIVAVSIITAFVTGSYFLPKVYEAESSVIIERNVINNFVEGIAITPSMEERLRNLSFAMKSMSISRFIPQSDSGLFPTFFRC